MKIFLFIQNKYVWFGCGQEKKIQFHCENRNVEMILDVRLTKMRKQCFKICEFAFNERYHSVIDVCLFQAHIDLLAKNLIQNECA